MKVNTILKKSKIIIHLQCINVYAYTGKLYFNNIQVIF